MPGFARERCRFPAGRPFTLPAIFPAALLVCVLTSILSPAAAYHLTRRTAIPGDLGWDYLVADEASHRVFVSHGDRVIVLDSESGDVAGSIKGLAGVHGIAVAADVGRGFISCGRSNTVKVFDLKTLAPVQEVKTGKNPDAIVYDSSSRRVLAFDGGSADATLIDTEGHVVATVALGGKPEFAVADGKGRVFVDVEDKDEVVAIDAKAAKVLARWPVAPGTSPAAVAIDVEHGRLFIGCHNRLLVVMDAGSGRVVATAPIGERVDAACYDPARGLVFASCGDGTVTVVHCVGSDKYSVVETLKTETGARTMALDARTHRIFLSSATMQPPHPAPAGSRERRRPRMVPGTFHVSIFDP